MTIEPCPFCAEAPRLRSERRGYQVACACGAPGPFVRRSELLGAAATEHDQRAETIAVWNHVAKKARR